MMKLSRNRSMKFGSHLTRRLLNAKFVRHFNILLATLVLVALPSSKATIQQITALGKATRTKVSYFH
jgi:hypothetical protein